MKEKFTPAERGNGKHNKTGAKKRCGFLLIRKEANFLLEHTIIPKRFS